MAYTRKVFTGFVLVLPLIFSSLISSESSDYNMPIGVTEVSESIFGLHMLIYWICVVIGVIVFYVSYFGAKKRGTLINMGE